MRGLILGLAIILFDGAVAKCDTFSVWGTGLGSTGQKLPAGSEDPHYSIVSAPPGYSLPITPRVTSNNPIPWTWAGTTPNSDWINPTGGGSDSFLAGYYSYQTAFDLSGLDPSTAEIQGNFVVDNAINVYLNGLDTGVSWPNGPTPGFEWFHPFSISTGFCQGMNTLVFEVYNQAGPTYNPSGLQVQITNATAQPIPEPSVLVLLGIGAISLLAYAWHRR